MTELGDVTATGTATVSWPKEPEKVEEQEEAEQPRETEDGNPTT